MIQVTKSWVKLLLDAVIAFKLFEIGTRTLQSTELAMHKLRSKESSSKHIGGQPFTQQELT